MRAFRHNFDLLTFREVRQADGALFVLEAEVCTSLVIFVSLGAAGETATRLV